MVAGARPSASEQVADDIRLHIQRQGLKPGDRLGREEDLARRFGVSRPTLREALRLLASANLLRATKGPGGGIFVALTAEEGMAHVVTTSVASLLAADAVNLDELLEARMLAEVPLAGLAAQRADAEQVDAMRKLIDESETLDEDDERLGEIDRELHRRITEAAGNRLAAAFSGWVVDVLQPVLEARLKPAIVQSALVQQHRDLLRAIERSEPVEAERAMREHLLYLRDVLSVVEEMAPNGATKDDVRR
jgi:DNA-binding FadR family transcriptional regulator